MYQSVIALLLYSVVSFANTPKEITKIYSDFEAKKTAFLKGDFTKKEAKEKVAKAYQDLEKALADVKAIESKSKETLLTAEGNQMAYDLETLSPIKDLAAGLISKEDCNKARHEHALNFPVIEDDESKAIESLINKLCVQ